MKYSHLIFLIINLCILNKLYGQTSDDSKLWNNKSKSIFNKIDKGVFLGTTNGYIELLNASDTIVLDFHSTEVTLNIIKDPEEMYDNSTKKYLTNTTSGKTILTYEIYALANILSINLNGSTYSIGIIDSASDKPISGLAFNYCSEKNIEYLTLFVLNPLILTTARELKRTKKISYLEAKKISKSITIMPGSTLLFTVKK